MRTSGWWWEHVIGVNAVLVGAAIFVGNILANGRGDPGGANLIFLAVSVSVCCYWRLAARMRDRNPPQR